MLHPLRTALLAAVSTASLACGEEPTLLGAPGACVGDTWAGSVPLDHGRWFLEAPAVADNGSDVLVAWNQHELVDGGLAHPAIAAVVLDSETGTARGPIFEIAAADTFDMVEIVVAGDGAFFVAVLRAEDTLVFRVDPVGDGAETAPRVRVADDEGYGWTMRPVIADGDGLTIVQGNFDVQRVDADRRRVASSPTIAAVEGRCDAAVQRKDGALLGWCLEWGNETRPFLLEIAADGATRQIPLGLEIPQWIARLAIVGDHVLAVTFEVDALRALTFDLDGRLVDDTVILALDDDDGDLSWERQALTLTPSGDRALLGFQHRRDFEAERLTVGTVVIDDDGHPTFERGATLPSTLHGAGIGATGGALVAWVHEGFKLFPWETGPQTVRIERRCGIDD